MRGSVVWYAEARDANTRRIISDFRAYRVSGQVSAPLLVLVATLEIGHFKESLVVISMCKELGNLRIASLVSPKTPERRRLITACTHTCHHYYRTVVSFPPAAP